MLEGNNEYKKAQFVVVNNLQLNVAGRENVWIKLTHSSSVIDLIYRHP